MNFKKGEVVFDEVEERWVTVDGKLVSNREFSTPYYVVCYLNFWGRKRFYLVKESRLYRKVNE